MSETELTKMSGEEENGELSDVPLDVRVPPSKTLSAHAEEWKEMLDESSGKKYYYNVRSLTCLLALALAFHFITHRSFSIFTLACSLCRSEHGSPLGLTLNFLKKAAQQENC